MNSIKYILTLGTVAAILLPLASCQKDQNIFSETPAERTQRTMNEALKTLQGAVYGWEMSVYPSPDKSFGGYTLFVRFDKNGTAAISDELQIDPSVVTESLYAVDNSNGPTLTFDTYNVSMHRYSEPASKSFEASLATGANGDYSFQIISATEDKVVLRGVRSLVYAELKPLKTAYWQPLVENIKNASNNFFLPTAKAQIDGTTVSGARMTGKRHLLFTYKGVDYDLPFRFTTTGIELYEPLSIAGLTVQTLTNKGTLEMPVLADASGKFEVSYEENLPVLLLSTVFQYSSDKATGRFASALSNMNRHLTGYSGRVADGGVYFGVFDGALRLYVPRFYYASSNYTAASLFITPEVLGPKEMKFTYDHAASMSTGDLSALLIEFRNSQILAAGFSNVGNISPYYTDGNYNGRTFELSAESGTARPQWIKLVDKSDKSNTVVLTTAFYN